MTAITNNIQRNNFQIFAPEPTIDEQVGFDPLDIFFRKAQPWVKHDVIPSMRGNIYATSDNNQIIDNQVVENLRVSEPIYKEQMTPIAYNARLAELSDKVANFLESLGYDKEALEFKQFMDEDSEFQNYYHDKKSELIIV
jgi:hypothetical protein